MTKKDILELPIKWWLDLAYSLEKDYNGLGFREHKPKLSQIRDNLEKKYPHAFK